MFLLVFSTASYVYLLQYVIINAGITLKTVQTHGPEAERQAMEVQVPYQPKDSKTGTVHYVI
jgi:hypothetical protein